MAEFILFNTVEKILGKVTSIVVQEFCLGFGLQSDLKKLKTSLSSIYAVILDAEEQQTTNHKITVWLRHLRDVLYDVEDVLDDFAYQALRKQVVKIHGGINRKVHRFISTTSNPIAYRLRIGREIKNIRLRLDDIAANKAEFNLADRVDYNGCVQLKKREMTHSFVSASEIIGRDADKETIVKFLMDSQGHDESVSVMSIVGIGGLGKTALAKMVFNDKRVVEHFYLKVWVCLGDIKEFNVNQVMEKIVKSVSGNMSVDSSNPEHLQIAIRKSLHGKRFLLVLDDMWDANRAEWLELKTLLAEDADESRIVVTTRSISVASCVSTGCSHNLKGLPHEECVSLFKKLAFGSESEVDQNLMTIGEEIVKKCKGVPLAVRSLGSLLFSKSDVHEWLLVKDSDIWEIKESQNNILPILKLSYDQLSSNLKQCFVYCSIFPEDYELNDVVLISFWMAHGLLQSPKKKNGGQEVSKHQPEYIGKQYITELLSRGFFHDFKEYTWCCTFKMHDLVHDLACSLGQEEFATINARDQTISENVRHVRFEVQEFSASSSNAIRTVLVPDKYFGCTVAFSESSISKFKKLRVLCLANSLFEELPNSIGTLKHLRSLDLRGSARLLRLPNSICLLHNLETLLLARCFSLHRLPEDIGDLINLRLLTITTGQEHFQEKNGIKCLTSLNCLGFTYCEHLETLFEGTEHLTALRTLVVVDCRKLISLSMNHLTCLRSLWIKGCSNLDQEHDVSVYLPSLRSLTIEELPQLEDVPQWVQGCATTLQYLQIKDCVNLKALPNWLPKLTYLRTLKIIGCPKLMSLPEGMRSLTALKELEIIYCDILSERCNKENGGGEDWPKIAHVPYIYIY